MVWMPTQLASVNEAPAIPVTWANRPNAAAVAPGTRIMLTDFGNRLFYSDGVLWQQVGNKPWAQLATPKSVTGTTIETVLDSVTIPGGMPGPNGSIRVTASWNHTSSANIKRMLIKLGGTAFVSYPATTSGNTPMMARIHNQGATNAQVGLTTGGTGYITGSGGSAATGSIDTNTDQVLTLSGSLADATETITLVCYTVEVLPA